MRYDPITAPASILSSPDAAAQFLAPAFVGLEHEELLILHLDGRFVPIHSSVIGGRGTVAMPVGRIARDAVALEAHAVLIAHNHPGGDAQPSRADRLATVRLAEALRILAVLLVDHLIFAGEEWTSFHRLGLL